MEIENFSKLPHKIYQEAVDKIAKLHKLDDKEKFKIEYSAGSAKGDNYLGSMFRIQIKCKKDNSIKLSLIAKLPPQSEARREELQVGYAFNKEIEFYDILIPMYKKFQEEKGIDAQTEGFHETPKVFLTINEAPYESIFFEDLKARNFEMFDRFKDVTKEHVIIVLKALAKMHALFFCIRDQKPELVKQFIGMEDFLLYLIRKGTTLLNAWYEGQKVHALKAIKKIKNHDIKKKIEEFMNGNMEEFLNEVIGINVAEPYSTICHGDVWNNNMMFKFNEKRIPIEVSFYDFQIIRYASPVIDVVHYIFTCTTKELRNKYYKEFLDIYYETLTSFIKRLDSDPEKLYPRHIFDEHLKKFGKFGLYMGILVLPTATCNAEDAPDLDEVSEKVNKAQNGEKHTVDFVPSEIYEKRMIGVFEDIYNFGYI